MYDLTQAVEDAAEGLYLDAVAGISDPRPWSEIGRMPKAIAREQVFPAVAAVYEKIYTSGYLAGIEDGKVQGND